MTQARLCQLSPPCCLALSGTPPTEIPRQWTDRTPQGRQAQHAIAGSQHPLRPRHQHRQAKDRPLKDSHHIKESARKMNCRTRKPNRHRQDRGTTQRRPGPRSPRPRRRTMAWRLLPHFTEGQETTTSLSPSYSGYCKDSSLSKRQGRRGRPTQQQVYSPQICLSVLYPHAAPRQQKDSQ